MLDIALILERFNRRPGASDIAIAEAEEQLGLKLPAEYVQFLKLTDGGEGFIGGQFAILWAVEELHSTNQACEFMKYLPGFLGFGSNGGGEAYGFDARDPLRPIVQVPFIGADWKDAWPLGESFSSFLEKLHATE